MRAPVFSAANSATIDRKSWRVQCGAWPDRTLCTTSPIAHGYIVEQPHGEDVTVVLEAGKTLEIEGRTTTSTFMAMPPEVGGGLQSQQALARYSYDGETVIGMIERSTAHDQVRS